MNLSSIDIGTNSVRLLIADCNNFPIKTLVRKTEITRIGKNLETTGKISAISAGKTLKVLSKYYSLIKKMEVKKYKAVGTSALRRAKNKDWFLNYIYESLGMKIEIVTGKMEAELSFSGAVKYLDTNVIMDRCNKNKLFNILVLDIGGGSSEFILGRNNLEIIFKKSTDIGCVGVTEKFINSDPPGKKELSNMNIFIKNRLKNILNEIKEYNFLFIIGLAGTITTLAAVDLGLKEYKSEKIHNHVLDLKKITKIYSHLCSLNMEDRKNIAGLEPKRADIIIGGTAIVMEIMKSLRKSSIIVSEKDILDGIIYSLLDS